MRPQPALFSFQIVYAHGKVLPGEAALGECALMPFTGLP